MNVIDALLYALYSSALVGMGDLLKSSNGPAIFTAEPSAVSRPRSKKKSNVASKVLEEVEERGVSREDVTKRAIVVLIVTPDAFQGQVESISDLPNAPPRLVDRTLPVDLTFRTKIKQKSKTANAVSGGILGAWSNREPRHWL